MLFRFGCTAGLLFASVLVVPGLRGQSVHRVDVFRDAVVVTWKAEAKPGACAVARSFRASDAADVLVFDAAGDQARGGLLHSTAEWFPSGGAELLKATETELKEATLNLALKLAQADLVEDDLALLRANRKVGGTAEALLVEDLAEVADWMHEEIRDLLYRRIELHAEVGALEETVHQLERSQAEQAAIPVHAWTVNMPEGSSGTLWTQVVERGPGMGWIPQDQLNLEMGTQPVLSWNQRADVTFDLPVVETEVPVRFHDAFHAGLEARPDARPAVLAGSYGRMSSKDDKTRGDAVTGTTLPGAIWEHEGLMVGHGKVLNVSIGSWATAALLSHYTAPKQSPVVNLRLVVPRPSAPVAEADRALLTVGDLPLGRVWLTEQGDSIRMDAGVTRAWSVDRVRQAALCSKSTLGQRVKHHRAYRITVTNRSGAAGEVVVEEPLPVSRNAQIEVAPEALDGGVFNEASGIVRWTFSLAAGESKTLAFAYDLSHGKDVPAPDFD